MNAQTAEPQTAEPQTRRRGRPRTIPIEKLAEHRAQYMREYNQKYYGIKREHILQMKQLQYLRTKASLDETT